MPRISQAASAVTRIGAPDRLAPPAEFGAAESLVFRQTVATAPVDHFRPEDLPLLCAYARAVVMERRAGEELGAMIAARKAPAQWLGTYGCVAKTMMSLAVRLRLGPLSRANNNRRSPKSGAASVSFYETMDLGEIDAESRSRSAAGGDANGKG